jgi:hypothetical protein
MSDPFSHGYDFDTIFGFVAMLDFSVGSRI